MTKQLSLVDDDKLDPQVAKDADRYVEAVKELKDATERKKKFAGLIVRALKKLGKSRVRHGDMIIEISEKAAAETIKIKKTKQAKVTKAPELKAPVKK
jgi:altronate dehydratase